MRRARVAAFSLIEVTMAVGIMGFAFVAILGMVPLGLSNFRDIKNIAVTSQISQQIVAEVQTAPFTQLTQTTGNLSATTVTSPQQVVSPSLRLPAPPENPVSTTPWVRYFSEQGVEVLSTDPAGIYQVNTRVLVGTAVRADGGDDRRSGQRGRRRGDCPGRVQSRQARARHGCARWLPLGDHREERLGADLPRRNHRRPQLLSMDRSRYTAVRRGFTLIELLVSMVVLIVLVVLLTQLINTLRGVISRTSTSIEEFRDARDAFETMTRRIAQATLNSYDDLDPTLAGASVATTAAAYVRASELRFISGDAATLLKGAYTGADYSKI